MPVEETKSKVAGVVKVHAAELKKIVGYLRDDPSKQVALLAADRIDEHIITMTKQHTSASPAAAPPNRGDGAPDDITPEMIEAGVSAFEFCEGAFPSFLMVARVYRAMRALDVSRIGAEPQRPSDRKSRIDVS
jgi:hypothetical protein